MDSFIEGLRVAMMEILRISTPAPMNAEPLDAVTGSLTTVNSAMTATTVMMTVVGMTVPAHPSVRRQDVPVWIA
jgi:hypothetical protein